MKESFEEIELKIGFGVMSFLALLGLGVYAGLCFIIAGAI